MQKPQDFIHNRVMQEICETNPQHPGAYLPKKDKILEWTLYGILQQLQGINSALNGIATNIRLKQ